MPYIQGKWELLQPGDLYPLRYNPENTEQIMLEVDADEADDETLKQAFDTYSEKVRNGPLVIGKILSAKHCPFALNEKTIINVTVQFNTVDGQQVTASDLRLISMNLAELFLFDPNKMIALRYHPNNPEQIMLTPDEEQETLKHVREIQQEKIKNGSLVLGMIISSEKTGWKTDDKDIVDMTIYFKTADGQEVTVPQRGFRATTAEEPHKNALIHLRYNPEDPQQILVATEEDDETLQHALDAVIIAGGGITQEEINMIKHGVEATGVILSAQPTGNIVDGCGEMALQVRVTRPSGGTYDVTINKPVSQGGLPSVQPDCEVNVFYMPENEANITINL
jgi:hypothetical protein